MAAAPPSDADAAIEFWKMKRILKDLEDSRGNGTSMITLLMPPGTQISQMTTMLKDEQGTAINIKSRVNKLSVLNAITSTLYALSQYKFCPDNGLAIFCGEVFIDNTSTRKVTHCIEPPKPLHSKLYLCDNKFHTEALRELLNSDDKFGFVVMDGNGTLFGTLCGNHREVLHKFSVELPKKHGRGGQSAVRFARLREEKRHNYVRKVTEMCVKHFITDNMVNVKGLIFAGSADFKTDLQKSDMLDPRIREKIIATVDIMYGGENGFNQAIDLSAELLANVKFIQEKKLIGKYFEEIAQDTGKFCYGVKDTMMALEGSAVHTLICFEALDINRVVATNHTTGQNSVMYLTPRQQQDGTHFHDKETGVELEIIEQKPLLEYLAETYKNYGCLLEFVTDRSQEGAQFVNGFGGIGALLRYVLPFQDIHGADDDDSDDSSSEGGI